VEEAVRIPDGLPQAMCQYYEAQEKRDWKKTYSLRPKDFRQVVGFDFYEKEMSEQTPQIALSRLNILSVKPSRPSEVAVRVDFYRGPGGASKPFDPSTGFAMTGETTEWIAEPEGWRCAGCGEVLLHAINSRMVFPD